jgi:hypothetical protein
MFIPYYKIVDEIGKSSSAEVPVNWFTRNANPKAAHITRFNPYRHIFFGGTLLGFRGKNYFISDDTFLGKLIKPLFT